MGHIHIGAAELKNNLDLMERTVKALDVFVGLPSVILDTDLDRRVLYGKAGAFRNPKHGLEYRTPSNFWVKSKDLVQWMFQNVALAIEAVNDGVSFEKDEELIVNTINNGDSATAEQLCNKYNIPLNVRKKQLVA